jgi:hypothetical protein
MDPVAAPIPSASVATSTRLGPTAFPTDRVDREAIDAQEARRDDVARPAGVLVALLALTIPLASSTAVWSTPTGGDDWLRTVLVAPFDLVLVAITGWCALHARLVVELFRARAVRVVGLLFALAFGIALVANPSPLGVAAGLRLVAGLAVIATVGAAFESAGSRRLALGAIALAGALQAVLGTVQSAQGEAFGIDLLDYAGPLYPFGSSLAGRGGLTHPYHLAVFLVMAQGAALLGLRHDGTTDRARWAWLAALAVIGGGIAVTYTRAGAIGQVMLLVCLVLGRRDRRLLLPAALAIVLGLGIGAVAFGDGWLARADTTTSGAAGTVDSNRGQRLQEARELVASSPIVGVGPGRYVDALSETERIEYLPAHNLVAHQAAELGVVGGVLTLALLALLALRVWRGGAWTGAVVVPVVPFLLLDAYPYVFATGLAVSAVWLGLARASLTPADAAPDLEAAPEHEARADVVDAAVEAPA